MNEDPNVVTLRSAWCFVGPAQPRDSKVMAAVADSAIRGRFDKLEVRVYGATAITTGIVEASDSPEAKLRKTIFTGVFVYRDNRWQAVNAQENEIGNGR